MSRYYNPLMGRWISPDSTEYLDNNSYNGLNSYVYCNNDPVNYYDPDGTSTIAVALGITAILGLGLTIGGTLNNNHLLTAIGLTMVAVPSIISGEMGIAACIGGATITGVIGGVTSAFEIGSAAFASAEYQEAISGSNWIRDDHLNSVQYKELMITISIIATIGTIASLVGYSFKIKSIIGFNKYDDFYGMRFVNSKEKSQILLFHTHGHEVKSGWRSIKEWHWQLKKWESLKNNLGGTIARWIWWNLKKMRGK